MNIYEIHFHMKGDKISMFYLVAETTALKAKSKFLKMAPNKKDVVINKINCIINNR